MSTLPPLPESLPAIPSDDEGPVFREPWEAQVFALVVQLHQAGAFTWNEWAEHLSEEIREAQAAGDPDTGETYYHHWLHALEDLVLEKNLASFDGLVERRAEVERTRPNRHDHIARRDPVAVARG